jgi:hypothetical protein
MAAHWRPKLSCHLLWHPGFSEGPSLADAVYSRLCRDVAQPISRGIGVPIFFHSWIDPRPDIVIKAVALDSAQRTLVLPLVDNLMIISDQWQKALEQLSSTMEAAPQGPHRLLPISLSENSYNISTKISRLNFLRLHSEPPASRPERLVAKLSHELCRLLLQNDRSMPYAQPTPVGEGPAPVRLFLSHAKQDGLTIVAELLEYLGKNSPVEAYFDATNIPPGFDFEAEIERGVSKSALLIAHSDLYASREWCRREVLFAKKYQCPILVMNAVSKGEDRSFPYLGNVPTIRWDKSDPSRCQQVVDLAVREVLRSAYFRAHLESLQESQLVPLDYQVLTRPPEILTYVDLPRVGATADAGPVPVIYPDPPLGDEEVALIHAMLPNAKLTTPTSSAHWIKTSSTGSPLRGSMVAISISESPDLSELGMGPAHLQDSMQEFARHVLANGGIVAYGGDLRPGGFTENLFDLVRTYRQAGQQPWERIRNYLAWPLHIKMDLAVWASYQAQYKLDAVFVKVPKAADISLDDTTFVPPDTLEHRYAWARSLTEMRLAMGADPALRARVLLGGKVSGYLGRYPGLVEEAYLNIAAGKPTYLCGGFGGCTRAIVEAVKGGQPNVLTKAYQMSVPQYADFVEYFNQKASEPIAYDRLCEFFASHGVAGLKNGLSPEDNETLFQTSQVTLMVYLVLKGLANLASGS